MEASAAQRRDAARQVVGDFRRPRAEQPGRAGERLQPKYRGGSGKLPRSASAGATSAGTILSDVDGQSGDHEFTSFAGAIWRSVERLVVVGFGLHAEVVHGLLVSVRRFLGAGFLGTRPQYVPGKCHGGAGERRRPGKCAADSAGGSSGELF